MKRAQTVQAYFARQSAPARKLLKQIRAISRSHVRGAGDAISYNIPAVTMDGRPLIAYAGWTKYVSVYPVPAGVRPAAAKLGLMSGKSTMRFPLDRPLPAALVKRLVKLRVADRKRGRR